MAKTEKGWFTVDKEGLAKVVNRHESKTFLVNELVQNAWDQNITQVIIWFKWLCKDHVHLSVEDDDPNGFADLTHAFTLFAESGKKVDPTKRGRFNLGEKLVLSLCSYATIATTTGTVIFKPNGEREESKEHTDKGSVFRGVLSMTKAEYEQVCKEVFMLIPPDEVKKTTFNGKEIPHRKQIAEFEESLPTELSNGDGNLRRTIRKCKVRVYKPLPDEQPHIYEMGIPVVGTDDKFHVNVSQKVPLNMDRNNVQPAYLRDVRTFVLNNTADLITDDDVAETWVNEGLADKKVTEDTVKTLMDKRYGEKRVSFDPSDPEANRIAMSQGYTVVYPKQLSAEQWDNVRNAKAILPAGQVTPSNKIMSGGDAKDLEIPKDDWTPGMEEVADYAERLGHELLGFRPLAKWFKEIPSTKGCGACYGGRIISFNKKTLGRRFFENFPENRADVTDLLIHEFAHEGASNHLSDEYYCECTRLAGLAVEVALRNPKLFLTKAEQ